MFFDQVRHFPFFRESRQLLFGKNKIPVDLDLENTSGRREQVNNDPKLFGKLVPQTGGPWLIVSLLAIFNRYLHLSFILSLSYHNGRRCRFSGLGEPATSSSLAGLVFYRLNCSHFLFAKQHELAASSSVCPTGRKRLWYSFFSAPLFFFQSTVCDLFPWYFHAACQKGISDRLSAPRLGVIFLS